MTLRIDARNDGAVVTIPPNAHPEEGIDLAQRQIGWIAERLAALPQRLSFADGVTVPVLGVDHVIRHCPDKRGAVRIDGCELLVMGQVEHLTRRLTDWFRGQARRSIEPKAHTLAAMINRQPGRITIRDTRSRWGSCSAKGCLSFSWRLVMAPESVLDYVVSHEVAHLEHMNHSRAFWATVETLHPDATMAQAWLRTNGEGLHRIG